METRKRQVATNLKKGKSEWLVSGNVKYYKAICDEDVNKHYCKAICDKDVNEHYKAICDEDVNEHFFYGYVWYYLLAVKYDIICW